MFTGKNPMTADYAERRTAPRFRFHMALAIQGAAPASVEASGKEPRVGISHDVSKQGVLFNTRSRFTPGDEVVLTLHMAESAEDAKRVRGRVVRVVDTAPMKMTLPWRYLTAVELSEPLPDIEDSAKKAGAAPKH